MTDQASTPSLQSSDVHTSGEARARLAKRYRKEAQFKYLGMAAVGVAILFLALLLFTIIMNAYKAFSYNYVNLPVKLEQSVIDPDKTGDLAIIGRADFGKISKDAMKELLPFASGRRQRRELYGLMTSDLGIQVREAVLKNPALIGTTASIPVQLDDVSDLYFKNDITGVKPIETIGEALPNGTEDSVEVSSTSNDFAVISEVVQQNLQTEIDKLTLRLAAKERSKVRLEGQITAMEERVKAAGPADVERLSNQVVSLKNDLAGALSQMENDTNQSAALQKRIDTPEANEAVPSQVQLHGLIVWPAWTWWRVSLTLSSLQQAQVVSRNRPGFWALSWAQSIQ